ncbi:MAG: hypothetical protein ABIG68_02545 [Acidobacteriota bacterium]
MSDAKRFEDGLEKSMKLLQEAQWSFDEVLKHSTGVEGFVICRMETRMRALWEDLDSLLTAHRLDNDPDYQ